MSLQESLSKTLRLSYQDLTIDEFSRSTYPDSKVVGIFTETILAKATGRCRRTGYKYSVGFTFKHPTGPYMQIETETRKDLLQRGSEFEAERTLRNVSWVIREFTGGYVDIHPFYGAIFGTNFSPISFGFAAPHIDSDNLSMIIDFSKAGNDDSRYSAALNRLTKQWDAEYDTYNNPRKSRVKNTMPVNQKNVANFMNYLQGRFGMTDLRVKVRYKDLTPPEISISKLPREKIKEVEDEHFNRIGIETLLKML